MFRPARPGPQPETQPETPAQSPSTHAQEEEEEGGPRRAEQAQPKKRQRVSGASLEPPPPAVTAIDDTPALVHIPAAAHIPVCATSDKVRDIVTHAIADFFSDGGAGVVKLSCLMQVLQTDHGAISDDQVKVVLNYLSDLNRVMLYDSETDIEIYQV